MQGPISQTLLVLQIGHVIFSELTWSSNFFSSDLKVLSKASETKQPHDSVDVSFAGAYEKEDGGCNAIGTESNVSRCCTTRLIESGGDSWDSSNMPMVSIGGKIPLHSSVTVNSLESLSVATAICA